MSRRESKIIGVAGGLQPKGHDLAQYRQRSITERRVKLRTEDAAGALAFASMDQYEGLDGKPAGANDPDATRLPGDPLVTLLLRLKYADQWAKDAFQRAQLILLHRYGGLSGKPSETLFAVAYAALAEWAHDCCPKCRGQKSDAQEPAPCEACRSREVQTKSGHLWGRHAEVDTAKGPRLALTSSPRAGCPKCGGTGKVVVKMRARRGMQCVSCGNSGRVVFHSKRRWRMVSEYLVAAQRARKETVRGLPYETFAHHWHARYQRFLDVLRAADRRLAAGLDLGFTSSERGGLIAHIDPEPEENQ